MCPLRDGVVFVAGAEFFHTISHIFLARYVEFPFHTSIMDVTVNMNNWAIGINAVITVLLLMWARRLKKKSNTQ